MAARENQGYLIAVIILVLACLILALLAFLGFYKSFENHDLATQFESKFKQMERVAEAYQLKGQIASALIGENCESLAEIDTLDNKLNSLKDRITNETDRLELSNIETQVQKLIGQHNDKKLLFLGTAANAQTEDLTYMGLLQNFAGSMGRLVNDSVVLQNEQTRIKEEADAKIDAKQKEVDQAQAELVKTKSELDQARVDHDEYVKLTTSTLNEIQLTVKSVEDDRNNVRTTLSNQVTDAQNLLAQAEKKYNDAKKRLDDYERENWDLADGKIMRVANSENIVYLNRGVLDGLKTTQTFSVYDANTTNFDKNNPKAAIEVTRVFEKSAEARIRQEDPLNPVLIDDVVVNPVWDPGHSVRVAIAGVFDLDHDGFDDRDRLIRMIQQNGGTVVAFNDSEGNISGEIDSSTRYFVLGDPPKMDNDTNPEINRAIRKLRDLAKEYQIQEIDTRKLLNWMGQHGQPQIERLDKGIGLDIRQPTTPR